MGVFRTFKSFCNLALKTALVISLASIFDIFVGCSGCSKVFRFQKTEHLNKL